MESRNKYEVVTAKIKRLLVHVALFAALVNILMLTGPIFMLQVYDRVLTSGSFSTLLGLFSIVIVLYSFMAAFDFIRSRMLSRISFKFDLKLSEASFSLWMNNTSRKFYTYKPVNDISKIRSFISSQTMANLFDLPWVPFYLLIVFLIHPYLGVLAMTGSLLISALAFTNQWMTKKSNLKSIQADSIESSLLEQCFKNKQTITSLGLVSNIRSKWKELRNEGLLVLQNGIEKNEVFTSVSKSLRLLLQSSILALGAYLTLVQEISPGMIVAASIIAGRALTPLDQVISQWKVIVKSKEAHKRLKSIYSSQSMAQEEYMNLPNPEGLLDVLGVTKFRNSRDKPPILDKVSFRVSPGEAVGVIGPSASGKSTLASILCNALSPELGEVKFDNVNSLQFDPERKLIGYLPQKVELFPGTIRDNISGFDQSGTDEDVISAAVIAGVHDMIVGFSEGYNAKIDSDAVNFSGGQIQRIALARAVYKFPKYLILDEPNSNLDSEGDEALKNAIINLKSMGHTILVLTHRPSAIAAVDKILILSNGRVVEFGEKELVLKKTLKTVSQ